jgi:hypothetical protein
MIFKTELQVTSTEHDGYFEALLVRVSEAIENHCNWVVPFVLGPDPAKNRIVPCDLGSKI